MRILNCSGGIGGIGGIGGGVASTGTQVITKEMADNLLNQLSYIGEAVAKTVVAAIVAKGSVDFFNEILSIANQAKQNNTGISIEKVRDTLTKWNVAVPDELKQAVVQETGGIVANIGRRPGAKASEQTAVNPLAAQEAAPEVTFPGAPSALAAAGKESTTGVAEDAKTPGSQEA
jgi:hypothetical protein